MPSKCKNLECTKYASYNDPDKKVSIYCKLHAGPNMVIIKLDKRICIHPDHENDEKIPRCSFGFVGGKPVYCKLHSTEGMVNLNSVNNKCKVCKLKLPSYALPSETKATHCAKCATDEMIDIVSNLCDHIDCRKNATYGFHGKKATRCKPHSDPNMVDVKNSKCQMCDKQCTFGLGKKATHCVYHKTELMVDCRHSTEICKECKTRATFGTGKRPTHCATHKSDDMTDIVSSMCLQCGLVQGSFGYIKSELFCKECSSPDMKDLSHKMCEICGDRQPTFNYKGVKPPRFCKGCALDVMVDVVNPMCKSCGLFGVNKKPYLCSYCKPNSTAREKTREMEVVNYLEDKGYKFIHNKSVGFVCGNYRPDIKIDCGTHFIIVEVDEDQHVQYDSFCETARVFNIFQAEGLPCIFIRYNPDGFRVNNKVKKVAIKDRLVLLSQTIDKFNDTIPGELLTVYRLFYDNKSGEYLEQYDIEKKYKDMLYKM